MIGSFPLPLPPSTVRELDRRLTGRLRKRENLLNGEGEEEGVKKYDGEKAWSSINRSILSALTPLIVPRGSLRDVVYLG
jgi:hypothetical protein